MYKQEVDAVSVVKLESSLNEMSFFNIQYVNTLGDIWLALEPNISL